uniref:Uncharacterized protein n=1 Tax=Strombidium inclinatum TaxID=197538 RepID=A0A7S3IRD3_9SPIT|mmetsp:Transcript_32201/g.49245  ORF Transcript_32201/g.49245 Transcript_32201/m.49245 type:complete len:187 (+) Transcript_32201:460-1020(+)
MFNIKPTQKEGDFTEIIEAEMKKIIFEHSHLSEKIMKRNTKMKEELHPELQRKQVLQGVLKSIWEMKPKEAEPEEKAKTVVVSEINDVERARMNDIRKKQKMEERMEHSSDSDHESKWREEQVRQIKQLNLTLMEQKSHDIKLDELQLKQIKTKLVSDFASLPPDMPAARQRVFELENLVKMMDGK